MSQRLHSVKQRILAPLTLLLVTVITFGVIPAESARADQVQPAAVSIAGDTAVGSLLTASITGAWDPVDATTSFQWKRGSSPISGATSSTYRTVVEDAGLSVTVDVTAEAAGFDPVTVTSNAISPVGSFEEKPTPTVSGTAAVGGLLTAHTGTWVATPSSFDYQWLRDSAVIGGATSSTYSVSGADVAARLSVRVTAKRTGFTDASATSSSTDVVVASDFSSAGSVSITHSGSSVGDTLTAAASGWSPTPDSYTYQWLRDGAAISGATGSTYDIADVDRGFGLTVRATAVKSGYNSSLSVSSAVDVARGSFAVDARPEISDSNSGTQFAVGHAITTSTGTFSPTPTSFGYQWNRNGSPIGGATLQSYTLVAADAGASITVTVTARHRNFVDESSESVSITGVGQFSAPARPTISGLRIVDHTLTANVTGVSPDPTTLAYAWYRDGDVVSGATSQTFDLTGADLNHFFKVRVTASRAGYESVTIESDATVLVGSTWFTATGTASIDDSSLQLGDVLSVTNSGWTPDPDSYTYRWLRNGTPIGGATEETYTIVEADLGTVIRVRVTPVRTGYSTSEPSVLSQTKTISLADFVTTGVPVISGSAIIPNSLSVSSAGVYAPDPTSTQIQWLRNGITIAGATTDTYSLAAADSGKNITARVTAVRSGYNNSTLTSDVTAVSVASRFTVSPNPVIDGLPQVGRTLTARPGAWTPEPSSYTYQWLRNGNVIPGRTSSTYDVVAADLTATISVVVQPVLDNYIPLARTSRSTIAVYPATFGPSRPVPTITGTQKVGQSLTADLAGWSPTPTSVSYQWLRNGAAISGATSATYVVTSEDLGNRVSVAATPARAGYTSVSATSLETGLIAPGEFSATSAPTISGTVTQGSTLTASVDSWTPSATPTYVWKRGGVEISGATQSTYQVSAADAGNRLTVSVTGMRAGYSPVTLTSDPTAEVPRRSFSNTTNPVILGDARVGNTIYVTDGSPSPLPGSVSYQWIRDGVDIPGETNSQYIPVADDLYHDITVTRTYSLLGYASWSGTSEESVTVAQGNINLVSAPVISGTLRVGRTLTANFGTWDIDVDSYTYQWFRDGTPVGSAQTILEADASAISYALTSLDVGAIITFGVIATKDGYADEQASSADTAPIGLSAFNSRPVPTITGVAKVASTLTAVTGSWSPNPSSYTFQWTRDGVNIDAATSQTYVLAPQDAGRLIRVVVNGVRAGYEGQSTTSLPTASIANTVFTATPVPTISGTVRVGATVTAVTSAWTPAATTSTFVWKRNGTIIPGAVTATYEIVAADLGTTLTVVQTGSAIGYTATPMTSAATVAVAKGVFATQPTPTLTGRAKIGSTLTASSAAWQPASSSLAYQWQRAGVNITGATGPTYVVQPVDAGSRISVTVTANRTAYDSVTKTSASSAVVDYLAFADSVLPTISGTEKVESTLTASSGEWSPTPTTFTYQWKRTVGSETTNIDGATGPTYVLAGADAGATISVAVTGVKLGYSSVTHTSDVTGVIANGTLSANPTPTLSGVPQVGVAYLATAGSWGPLPVQLAYQWLRDDEEISGATSATFIPIAADVDARLSVRVTGSKLGYDTVVRTSAKSSAVVLGFFSAPTPTIAGTPKVGVTLTATPGVWSPVPSPARTFQWKRTLSGTTTNISGATELTYTPVAADVGATLSFTVAGGLDGYVTLAKSSLPTVAVARGTFSSQPTPAVSGPTTPSRVGQQLTVSVGRWTPLETSVSYQWKRDGVPISGATADTYDTQAADLNKSLTVTATATLAGYVDGVTTSAARVISAGIFSATVTPVVSGTTAVNSTLTATPGVWAPVATFAYQWKRAGTDIAGATGSTYVLRPEDADKKLTVVVTGSRPGYSSVSVPSSQTATVDRIVFTATPEPTLSGTAAVGQTLTATPGTWLPSSGASPVVLTYRWEKDGNPISGATASTYVITAADEGSKIRVYVTGTKLGYVTAEQPSAETNAVVKGTLATTPKPTITGNAQVGVQLTAVPGVWQPSVTASPITFDYQWKRDGSNISSATSATYTPVPADVGKAISVSVTGKKAGYTSVTQTSDPLTRLVTVAGTFSTVPRPTITGTAKVGVELTAVPGSWVPSAGSLAYQWKRTAGATTTNISGATVSTYTPTADDAGKIITVVVTATTTGYATTASAPSIGTAAVALGTFSTPSTLPEISGTVRVGETLTATSGSAWPGSVSLAYQWNRNGAPIAAATSSTYRLVSADSGARITVTVTGSVAGYAGKSITSAQTVSVAATSPGAPTALATSGVTATSLVLRWTAPGDNGGSAITDYKVEYSSDGGTNWVVVTHPVSTAVSLTVSGLITRTDYKVRVSTKNAVGFSSPSTVLSVTTL